MSDTPLWKLPLREGCYMVGKRDPDSLLQCNTYLRLFGENGPRRTPWCIDPGSQIDFAEVRAHLVDHLGSLSELKMFSINHQDPDVVGNLIYLTQENLRLTGLATLDVWRLVRHLNVQPRQLYFAEQARDRTVRLPSGHSIIAVPTPFCHFRGAMAFYDPESQVLFSGDLFGGMNIPGRVQLYAEEPDWTGIAQFHQIYMPSRAAVAHAIRQIRRLQPAVRVIAPQHGFVLAGDFLHVVLERLERLPMGLDLLEEDLQDRQQQGYQEVLELLIHEAALHLSRGEVLNRLRHLPPGHDLHDCLQVSGADVNLLHDGLRALPLVIDVLSQGLPPAVRAMLKTLVLRECSQRQLLLPSVGVGIEELWDRLS